VTKARFRKLAGVEKAKRSQRFGFLAEALPKDNALIETACWLTPITSANANMLFLINPRKRAMFLPMCFVFVSMGKRLISTYSVLVSY